MQKCKKMIAALLFMACLFFLTGWGEKAVELLDDTPLIVLKEAIKDAPIGKQGNTLKLEELETESEEVSLDNQDTGVSSKESMVLQSNKTHNIEIRDKRITYDGKVCKDVDDLKSKIINDCSNGTDSVYLVDNYAETQTYHEVLIILEQLHESMKLEYNYD